METKHLHALAVLWSACCAAAPLAAQGAGSESPEAVAERVFAGGDLQASKWRRGSDGMLEVEFYADMGMPRPGRFVPLLGKDLQAGLRNCGAIGYLSLLCQGDGDLLSMTDAGFHLRCLGVDTSDVGLRQFLAQPLPQLEEPLLRADRFDRALAIDLLRRRGCKGAEAELLGILKQKDAPALLRQRAEAAIAALHGAPTPLPRRRLDAEQLPLPAAFDGCLVVDHARLPDLGWLTGLGRRVGMRITARTLQMAGGSVSEATCNGAQYISDQVCELPFGVALQIGNARVDQSCFTVTVRADERMPFAVGIAAAGEFEPAWQTAAQPGELWQRPFPDGSLQVQDGLLLASTDGSKGRPRPQLANELLRDTGAALRIVIPQQSRLWLALGFLRLPQAKGAELRLTFGDPAQLVLEVQARDEDGAEEWLEIGTELLATAQRELRGVPGFAEALQRAPELGKLLDALFAAQLAAKGDRLVATANVAGFGRAQIEAIADHLTQ